MMKKRMATMVCCLSMAGTAFSHGAVDDGSEEARYVAMVKEQRKIIEESSIRFLTQDSITVEASEKFLKEKLFGIDEDELKNGVAIIHNKLFDEQEMPVFFAFNEGGRVLGVSAMYGDENKSFFQKMAKSKNVNCASLKSRAGDLMACHHKSIGKNALINFQKELKFLVENSG